MSDAIVPVGAGNQQIANLLQIFALKKTKDSQKSNVAALLSALPQQPAPTPSPPHLGNLIDVVA